MVHLPSFIHQHRQHPSRTEAEMNPAPCFLKHNREGFLQPGSRLLGRLAQEQKALTARDFTALYLTVCEVCLYQMAAIMRCFIWDCFYRQIVKISD